MCDKKKIAESFLILISGSVVYGCVFQTHLTVFRAMTFKSSNGFATSLQSVRLHNVYVLNLSNLCKIFFVNKIAELFDIFLN